MGETRVDLHHLLEDLRDAYPGSIEETILTEIVANSLDSGATRITLAADPAQGTLTVVDDGSGMQRRELARLAGVSETMIHQYEHGKSVPLYWAKRRLAKALPGLRQCRQRARRRPSRRPGAAGP